MKSEIINHELIQAKKILMFSDKTMTSFFYTIIYLVLLLFEVDGSVACICIMYITNIATTLVF